MAEPVEIVEVGPRDGLQSDAVMLDTQTKVEFITRLVEAGIRRVEAVSFVNPKRVPQMADAEAVMEQLPRRDDVSYIGLVLNRRGFERALAAEVDEVNAVVMVTDTFSQKNQGMSTGEAVQAWTDIATPAHDAGMPTSVTLSAAFGCPYEGEVSVDRLVDVAGRVAEHGPGEIALADSIGAAVPADVVARIEAVRLAIHPSIRLRCHFHNTRNTGLANAAAALDAGVRTLDASIGGMGGCPFAPRATGNIPTEDLAYLVERTGYETGVSLPDLISVVEWLEGTLGHGVPGLLAKAGPFPSS